MSAHMPSRNYMRRLCVELTEGDGLDPRKSLPDRPRRRLGHGAPRPDDRKALQLCHQISQTLDEVFADCRDDVLRDLRVVAVEPAPDAHHLLVTVVPEGGFTQDGPAPVAIVGHLTRAAGHLRAEVANAITRKRTPLLTYRLAASFPETERPYSSDRSGS